MKQNENWFANMDEIIANYLSDERPAGAFATSLDIAKVTGREHRNVLRDIRNILENMRNTRFFNQLKVEQIEYTDKKGRAYPAFSMDQSTFLHVISKFDDEARWILVMTYNELLKLQPARPEHPSRPSAFKKETANPDWGNPTISLEDNGNLGGQSLNIFIEKSGLKSNIKVEHNPNESLGILKLYNVEYKDDNEFNTTIKLLDFFTGDSEYDTERIIGKIKQVLENLYAEGINFDYNSNKKLKEYITLVTKVFIYLKNRGALQKKYPAANTLRPYSSERSDF